jgi:hypothetical protein
MKPDTQSGDTLSDSEVLIISTGYSDAPICTGIDLYARNLPAEILC